MPGSAQQYEGSEQQVNGLENKVMASPDNDGERNRNREVGQADDGVRNSVGPDQRRFPQEAKTVRCKS